MEAESVRARVALWIAMLDNGCSPYEHSPNPFKLNKNNNSSSNDTPTTSTTTTFFIILSLPLSLKWDKDKQELGGDDQALEGGR